MANLSKWVMLFRRGENKPRDGRPSILVDDTAAADMLKAFQEYGGPLAVNYAHAPYDTESKNMPFPDRFINSARAPQLEWRERGFYALMNFTEKASEFIHKKEMDSISAEVLINPKTRRPYRLLGAALCNRAALALDPITVSTFTESDNQTISNEAIDLSDDDGGNGLMGVTKRDEPAPATNLSAATAAGVNPMSKLSEVAILLGESGESPDVEQIAEKGLTRLNAYKAAADVIALAVGLDPKVCTLTEIGNAVKEKLAQAEQFDPTKFTTIEKFNEVQLLVETEKKASAEKENELKLLKAEEAVRPYTAGEVKITPKMKPFAIKQYLLGEDNFKEYVSGLTSPVTLGELTGELTTTVNKISVGKQMALDAAKVDPSIKLVEQPSSAKE